MKATLTLKPSRTKSERLWEEAKSLIPGGVNSPVRSFRAVGGTPLFIDRGFGSKIYDVDGKEYIDYVMSWGPLILGHANAELTDALRKVLMKGTSFGAPTEGEVELAQHIRDFMPSLEKVRLVSSGTEAVMSALRLVRAFTRREKILKFEGCYHGHVDTLLVKAGSGALSTGAPTSAGLPRGLLEKTLIASYNDLSAVQSIFEKEGKEIACVIVEPIAGNMGVIPPRSGFLELLREITKRYNTLLVFDEVITGFRVGLGGAQERYGVTPDLTILGKIIGGGLPIGAFGGRKEIMDLLAPEGPVYQAGTLSGNPLSVACGNTMLKILSRKNTYEVLEEKGASLEEAIQKEFLKRKLKGFVSRVGSLFTLFFGISSAATYQDLETLNKKQYKRFFHECLKRGVYFPPSPFEASFLSLAHSAQDLEKTKEVFSEVLRILS
ncbi:MAG: glutamate-1-semialdehyde 2,1-aminomutase [Candidatus Omnitrophica bacterium]|nr:glutamate-1-semialdehyde 2,1-aminomutase [Candidatus Omnitrophota bacterium]